MKGICILFLSLWVIACKSPVTKIEIDASKHAGLKELASTHTFKILHSEGHETEAKDQADLVQEAYKFLAGIMGPKQDFCLMVVVPLR